MTLPDDNPSSTGGKRIEYLPSRWTPLYKLAVAILQSTILLAAVTATLFYIGFTYYAAYLGSFADISLFPSLGTSEYLTKAFDLIFASRLIVTLLFPAYIILLLVRHGLGRLMEGRSSLPYFRITIAQAATVFALGTLTLGATYMGDSKLAHPATLSIALMLILSMELVEYYLGVFVQSSGDEQAMASFGRRRPLRPNQALPLIALAFLFLVVFVGRWLASSAASNDVKRFFDRPAESAMQVQFDMTFDNPEIEGHLFRVVLQRGGNYFVVPIGEDGRPSKGLIVIPESGVVSVRVSATLPSETPKASAGTPSPSP